MTTFRVFPVVFMTARAQPRALDERLDCIERR
jgi:hypothetical protein